MTDVQMLLTEAALHASARLAISTKTNLHPAEVKVNCVTSYLTIVNPLPPPCSIYPQGIWEEAAEADGVASLRTRSSYGCHSSPQGRQQPERQHKLWPVQWQGRRWVRALLR